MTVKALLKQLAKEGFSIVKLDNSYRVRGNQAVGAFTILNGRPVNLFTIHGRIGSEYNEGYQPRTFHYSSRRFLAALKEH